MNNTINVPNNLNEFNTNKKKTDRLLFMTWALIALLLAIAGYYAYELAKDNSEEYLFDFNVSVVGFELDQTFDVKKYEYSLTVDTKEVQVVCSTDLNVEGCNEIIAIDSDKVDHIVKYIDSDNTIYTYIIHINRKETSEPIKINSIKNQQGNILIDAYSSENKTLEYSFDNGTTWQSSNQYKVDNNGVIQLIIRDSSGNTKYIAIEVNDIDRIPPTVNIIVTEKNETRIILTAEATDDYSEVELYNWNNTGYGNSKTYEVVTAGTYTVSVVDRAGNESVTKSITIVDSDFVRNTDPSNDVLNKKTYTIQLVSNGADITSTNLSCTTNEINCTVKLPTISRAGWTIIGWSENSNAQTAQYQSDEEITITENMTLYAITAKKLTASFDKNGATSIGSTSASCNIYNTDTTCMITTPKITMKNGSVIGWSDSKTATTSKYDILSTVAIDTNKTFYAITTKSIVTEVKKTITVTLDKNGATNIGKTSVSCTSVNGNACSIELPSITRTGWTIIGWSEDKNAKTVQYKVNDKINVSTNKTLYAITTKKITATFDKNGATNIGSTSATCSIYNTNTTCTITTPTITMTGGSVIGWSDNKTATTSKYNVSSTVALNADKTFYAITKKEVTPPPTTVKTVTIQYNASGGVKAPQPQTGQSNSSIKLSAEVPIRIGYQFLGWSTSQDGNVAYNAGGTYRINQDLTLYAVWQRLYVDNNSYSYNNLTSSNKLLFNKTTTYGIYNYAPSAFQDGNGLIHIFYVGNKKSEVIVDHIYHRTIKKNSSTGYYYSNENVVLEHSSGKWDSVQVCDPTVIKGNFQYNGVSYKYLMVYLGVATYDNSLNQIGLAVSNNLNSQFIKVTTNSPFIKYPANSAWGVGQPTAINLDGNGKVLISYTQGLTNKTSQLFGIYDLSNLNSPRTINTPKEISTSGALSYISNADIAIDLINDRIWLTAHQGYTYEKNSVTGTTNYIPSKSMVMSKKLNFGAYNSLSDAVYYALTTSTNPWSSTLLSGSYLIHNTGFIRDPYGYVNGINNINNYLLISTAQTNGSQNDQLWSYRIQLY